MIRKLTSVLTSSTFIRAGVATIAIAAALSPLAASAISVRMQNCLTQSGLTVNQATSTVIGNITLGNCEVAVRMGSLASSTARVNQMRNVSVSEKAVLGTEIQNTVSGLSSQQTKLDADTTLTAAATDRQDVAQNFRVYMLVMPQVFEIGAYDRVSTIVPAMQTVSAQLATDNASNTNANQSQIATLISNLNSMTTDAQTQANAAYVMVQGLTPDNGNQTIKASNQNAVSVGATDLQTSMSDLQNARLDITQAVQLLKAAGITP